VPTITEKLLNRYVRHALLLERLKNGEVRRWVGDLNANVLADIDDVALRGVDRIRGRGAKVFETGLWRRLDSRMRAVSRETMTAWHSRLATSLDELAKSEGAFGFRVIRQAVKAGVPVGQASASVLRAIRTSRPFQGRLLREWATKLDRDTYDRLRGAIRTGMVNGESTSEIMRRVRNGPQGMKVSRRDAAMIVRTAVTHVAARAVQAAGMANPTIFDRMIWQAILDSRTSAICLDLHGDIFPIDRGPRPPAHPFCRSQMGLVAIGDDPVETTGDEWLAAQSTEMQDSILGPGRARIFRSGKVPFHRFVTGEQRTLSLRELEALEVRLERV